MARRTSSFYRAVCALLLCALIIPSDIMGLHAEAEEPVVLTEAIEEVPPAEAVVDAPQEEALVDAQPAETVIQAPEPVATQETPAEGPSQEKPAEEASQEIPAENPKPSPRVLTVIYDPNGGVGTMDARTFTEGEQMKLDRCSFTRSGYTFEGWSTTPGGKGEMLADAADVTGWLHEDTTTLYARWGSQIYQIRYASGVPAGSATPATGSMNTQLAVHDAPVRLMPCGFERTGYTATGWQDSHGTLHPFESEGYNFVEETNTTSWEAAFVSMTQARENVEGPWSCQGSVVFEGNDGKTYVAVGFIRYDSVYVGGSLDTYDSEICVFNLETGELVKHASRLMLEHANDIAYCPDNGHFYVAQGGLRDNYPNGIVELDENLNEVRTMTPEGCHHIWNITYSDGVFYAIGNVSGDSFARGNPTGDTSDLIRLDRDLNVIDVHAIDFSSAGFSGQGMACEANNLYAILINFSEHDSKQKQRLTLFTLDGEPRGSMRIDITSEVESASWLNGRMYFTVNGGTGCTVFGTDLASTTMTAVWQPNRYKVAFDGNGVLSTNLPKPFELAYDSTATLPEEAPSCPGHEFLGWNTRRDGTGESFEPGESVRNLSTEGTVTLYAQWTHPALALVADNGQAIRPHHLRNQQARTEGPLSDTASLDATRVLATLSCASLMSLALLTGRARDEMGEAKGWPGFVVLPAEA